MDEGRRAPSLHLWYNDDKAGDILCQDVLVPSSGLTPYTYYCCMNWNSGVNGGGYCGIQDHPDGRNYIFSIWDPIGSTDPIVPVYKGPGTICERFGGEGTGLKSWNFSLGWEPDHWYTLVARCWNHDDHTRYGFWVHDKTVSKWTHLVTVDFPMPGVRFQPGTVCFLEDWMGSGENIRQVQFRNGFKRNIDGQWCALTKAKFNVVKEDSSRKYENNVDAGLCGEGRFYLQSGGVTCLSPEVCSGTRFDCPGVAQPCTDVVDCSIISALPNEMVWQLADNSAPQFRYTLKMDGKVLTTAVDSELRMCTTDTTLSGKVQLIIEDIYGKEVEAGVTL